MGYLWPYLAMGVTWPGWKPKISLPEQADAKVKYQIQIFCYFGGSLSYFKVVNRMNDNNLKFALMIIIIMTLPKLILSLLLH